MIKRHIDWKRIGIILAIIIAFPLAWVIGWVMLNTVYSSQFMSGYSIGKGDLILNIILPLITGWFIYIAICATGIIYYCISSIFYHNGEKKEDRE